MKNFKTLFGLSIFTNLVLVGALFYLVQRLGGVKFMVHRINAGGLAGLYENRQNLFRQLTMEKGSIIFLGDSITEFGQWEELMGNPRVKNRGIAGDTTWGLLRRLRNITESSPSSIFLMIGVNDFLFTDQSEIIKNYQEIIKTVKEQAKNTKLIIQSVLPVNDAVKNTVFDNKEISSLNKELQQLAKQEGLVYLDIHHQLVDKNGDLDAKFTADGVHINGAAYIIWKEMVQKQVDESINNQ